MTTMTISLPDELATFVTEQVKANHYESAADYLGELIRRQRDTEELRRKLLEGAQSGPGRVIDEQWFAELHARALERT